MREKFSNTYTNKIFVYVRMSSWIDHVKATAKKLGCSYGDAMGPASKTWKKVGSSKPKTKKPKKKKEKKTIKPKKSGAYVDLPKRLKMSFEDKKILLEHIKKAQKGVKNNFVPYRPNVNDTILNNLPEIKKLLANNEGNISNTPKVAGILKERIMYAKGL